MPLAQDIGQPQHRANDDGYNAEIEDQGPKLHGAYTRRNASALRLTAASIRQFHKQCKGESCQIRTCQAQRLLLDDAPSEPIAPPRTPTQETETATQNEPESEEPTLTPEQARLNYMHYPGRFEDYQVRMFRASFPQTQPE